MKETKLRRYMQKHPMRILGATAAIGAAVTGFFAAMVGLRMRKKKK
jgi:hypothetical protein